MHLTGSRTVTRDSTRSWTEAATAEYFDMVKYSQLQRQIEGKAPYTESCKKDDIVR